MLAKEFYNTVILSEDTATAFLREHHLLLQEDEVEPCTRCGRQMVEKRRRDRGGEFRPIWRCPKKGCQTSRSVRTGNSFFFFTDINQKLHSNLTLSAILEIVYYFTMDVSVELTSAHTGKVSSTIVDWFNMCREVCSHIVSVVKRGQLRGTAENPVQINESKFTGRRKARLLQDNQADSSDSQTELQNKKKVGGGWVFGFTTNEEIRFFVVENRDRDTVIPIIQREVQGGSHIHSDEWPAYNSLSRLGYVHKSVKQQRNHADLNVVKKKQGIPFHKLQSHLDYETWKHLRKNEECKFVAFLKDVADVYSVSMKRYE